MSNGTQLETAIKNIFGAADHLARATKFVQRVQQGKFTGKSFAAAQALGLLQRGEVSMSDLSTFATHVRVQVTGQGIDQRFSERTATFLREVRNRAFTQVVAADPVAIALLQRFACVIVQESSTFPLPDDLQAVWKGCGGSSAGTLAAFKIQVRWDLLTGAFRGMALQDGRQPATRSALKEQRRSAKSVRNADLGYFDTAPFEQEAAAGEYFFSRLSHGALQLFDEHGQLMDLQQVLHEHASQAPYQSQVFIGAQRRVAARLIAIPVPEAVAIKRQNALKRKAQKHSRKASERLLDLSQWTLLVTNIAAEELSIREALVLLRLRWQIEWLFKLWKQYAQADTSRSQQPWHMLCDYYAKLLGLLIVHWFMIVGCWRVPDRSMVKASQSIRWQVVLLAKALGGKLALHWVVLELLEGLDRCRMNPRRSHPNTYQLLVSASLETSEPTEKPPPATIFPCA